MHEVVGHQEAERREEGQEQGGIAEPRARQEPHRDDGQQEHGQEDEEIDLRKTGEAQEPSRGECPPRGAAGACHQPGKHPGHHETLRDRLGHRELREPDLRQRDGRERGREPGGMHAAQPPRDAPQANQAQGREEGCDDKRGARRADGMSQGGEDRKQRGKAGGDRGVGDVGDQEAAGESRKLARRVQGHPIPEQLRAAGGRQRAQQGILELERAMVGNLTAEVQIDGGVASGHRGLVRREEQRGAQQNPRRRRQRRRSASRQRR